MRTIMLLLLLTGTLLFAGCQDNNSKEEHPKTESTKEEHHHEPENERINLNNGNKWVVDANMMVPIRAMEKEISNFNGTTMPAYKTLSGLLQTNVDALTSNCTMEGQAHDELHKWLVPYIAMVSDLSEANDEKSASEKLENIKISFQTFNQYFE